MQGLPSYGRLTFHGLGGSLRLAQKIIAGNPAKNLVIRRLVIIKHRVDTTLPTKIGQRPEEAGLTQIKPVMLTIVGSAIAPPGGQASKLAAVPSHTGVA